MKSLTARTRYALVAAMDLAEHYDGERPIKVRQIAARTGVPTKFLLHILLDLKRAALANSTRGAKGGYWLLRPPDMISAAEVVEAAERQSSGRTRIERSSPYDAIVDGLWEEMRRRDRAMLADLSLADLLGARPPA